MVVNFLDSRAPVQVASRAITKLPLVECSVHDRMQLLAFMEAGVSESRNRHGIWFLSVESNSVVRLEHNRAHRRHALEVNDVEKATDLFGQRLRYNGWKKV